MLSKYCNVKKKYYNYCFLLQFSPIISFCHCSLKMLKRNRFDDSSILIDTYSNSKKRKITTNNHDNNKEDQLQFTGGNDVYWRESFNQSQEELKKLQKEENDLMYQSYKMDLKLRETTEIMNKSKQAMCQWENAFIDRFPTKYLDTTQNELSEITTKQRKRIVNHSKRRDRSKKSGIERRCNEKFEISNKKGYEAKYEKTAMEIQEMHRKNNTLSKNLTLKTSKLNELEHLIKKYNKKAECWKNRYYKETSNQRQTQSQIPCKYGNDCVFWKKNTCRYYHNRRYHSPSYLKQQSRSRF